MVRDQERVDRERLDEREAEDHRREDRAGGARVARDALERGGRRAALRKTTAHRGERDAEAGAEERERVGGTQRVVLRILRERHRGHEENGEERADGSEALGGHGNGSFCRGVEDS